MLHAPGCQTGKLPVRHRGIAGCRTGEYHDAELVNIMMTSSVPVQNQQKKREMGTGYRSQFHRLEDVKFGGSNAEFDTVVHMKGLSDLEALSHCLDCLCSFVGLPPYLPISLGVCKSLSRWRVWQSCGTPPGMRFPSVVC